MPFLTLGLNNKAYIQKKQQNKYTNPMSKNRTPTISYYKAPRGIFLKLDAQLISSCYRINGKEAKPHFIGKVTKKSFMGEQWLFLSGEKEIKKVSEKVSAKHTVVGFKLKDESLASKKIPKYITQEEAQQEYDDNYEGYVWKNHNDIRSLYVQDQEVVPEHFVEIEFELDLLGDIKVENQGSPKDMTYTVYRTDWKHEGVKNIDLSDIARWSEIEKMLNPEFALVDRPCNITSKQTYDIVRHYVSENINPKCAVITSDYDFCFTVKKKIQIKPYTSKWEEKKANGRSYARPKIHSRKIEHKAVEIFNMTHELKGYQGYDIIKGFKGDSLQGLADNVKLFLDELIFKINEPVVECDHCGGTGHIIK